MRLKDENEEYNKLKLTRTIAEFNFEEAMKKVYELRFQLEKAEKMAEEHQKTMLISQKKLDEFLNSFHSHSSFYKNNS